MRTHVPHTRRGAAYLVALLAGSIVTVTGLAALSMTTTRARTAALADQASSARTLARSGMDHALCAISAHLDGGGTRSNIFGAASPSVTMGGGTFGWSLARMDGSALGNTDEPIVVRAKAQQGQARYALQGTLAPSGTPFDVLDTGMYVRDDIILGTLSNLTSDKVVAAGDDISANTATVSAPIEAGGQVSGALFLGSTASGAAERRAPDESLIDHYVSLGQRIDVTSLPVSGSSRVLESVLLSPASNPYGATNPYGIYILDADDTKLHVRNVRVSGTLVIVDAEWDDVIIGSGVLLQPAFDWMPSLIVDGGVTFMGSSSGPSESTLGLNLNPAHTPYLLESDADTSDSYPGRIEGVSYISGDAVFAYPRQNIYGTMIIGDDAIIYGSTTVSITYNPRVATMPPVGFFEDEGGLALDPSSIVWRIPD
ncbi:MAG: hypothetical protein ACIAQU_10070 [Phycisphaerales bacterium JB064]